MKAVIFALTILASVFAQAASSYDCSFEGEQGSIAISIAPIDATTLKVMTPGQEDQVCSYDESAEAIAEVNAGFSQNGVTIDAELLVTCEGETADATILALVSKTPIVAEGVPAGINTVLLSPVVGPIAAGVCTKK